VLSSELESFLNQAFRQARSAHHEFLEVEHLLLAILETLGDTRLGSRTVGEHIERTSASSYDLAEIELQSRHRRGRENRAQMI